MSLTFLYDSFPKLRPYLKGIYYVCSYVFWGVIAVYGYRFTTQATTARSTLLPITLNYVYAAVPICAVLSIILSRSSSFTNSPIKGGGKHMNVVWLSLGLFSSS